MDRHTSRHTVVYHPAQLSNTPPHVPSDGSGDTRIEDGCRDGLVALTPAAHTKEAYATPRNRRPSYVLGPHQYRCFESTLPGSTRAVRHMTGSGLWQILEDERILSRSGLTFSHCEFCSLPSRLSPAQALQTLRRSPRPVADESLLPRLRCAALPRRGRAAGRPT